MTQPDKFTMRWTELSVGTDVWEVDYFDEDEAGRKLLRSHLGVRVNGGTWMYAHSLVDFISSREADLNEDRKC